MTFVRALNHAKDTSNARDYISRVKSTVANELISLDPSAEVDDTQYFNHSAVPDFVMRWKKEGVERSVYLRDSFDSVLAAEETDYLAPAAPVLLSLDTAERSPGVEEHLKEKAQGNNSLVTDAYAFDVIGRDDREETPMSRLLQANFARGARGLIDEDQAESLVQSSAPGLTAEDRAGMIAESFREDAALRINRTSQLMALALDPDSFEGEVGELAVSGHLSIAEMRHIVPWLLEQEIARSNSRLWEYLGTLFSLADLELIRSDLDGIDLGPLVRNNADNWSAKWSFIGLALDDAPEEHKESRSPVWSFQNGSALGVNYGDERLYLAHNGQLASKGRDGTSSARWESVRSSIEGERLARVDLKGITRSVILNAEQSDDIRSDVESVAGSLDDTYTVNEIAILADSPEGEGSTQVDVKFGNGICVARKGANIGDIVRVSTRVLNYRNPASLTVVNDLLGVHPGSR